MAHLDPVLSSAAFHLSAILFTETEINPQCPCYIEIRSITTGRRTKRLLDLIDYRRPLIKSMHCTNSTTSGDRDICNIQDEIWFLEENNQTTINQQQKNFLSVRKRRNLQLFFRSISGIKKPHKDKVLLGVEV